MDLLHRGHLLHLSGLVVLAVIHIEVWRVQNKWMKDIFGENDLDSGIENQKETGIETGKETETEVLVEDVHLGMEAGAIVWKGGTD